jgi:thiol-disulfide isomerase/thioredoxin
LQTAATSNSAEESMAEESMADESMADESTTAVAGVDLDFTATTLDGATFEGATLVGKPALLWFWAPWCPTCAGQADHVSEVADTYAGKVNVVGVGGLDQADAMRTFVEDRGVDNFVHLSDEAGVVWQRFGITSQSTYVVLDAKGVVVAQGVLSQDDLDQALLDSLA